MAISTNGTVIARLAGGLYNQTLSNATYNEVVAVVKSAADINTLANDLYARDFASKKDLDVAKILVANLGLSSITGLDNWVSAQLTAAGAAGKGAKVVSLLNDLSNLTSDATYGSYAAAFNAKADAALALSQKAGAAGGDFNAAATLAAAEAAAAAAKAAADAAAKAAADAAAKAAADAAAKAAADAAAKVIADADAAAKAPQTFTLTTGVDSGASFTGKAGDDSFNSALFARGATGTTINPGDNLVGSIGIDTLNISVTGDIDTTADATDDHYTLTAISTTGIEKILLSNFEDSTDADANIYYNAISASGLTTVGLSASGIEGDTVFQNVPNVVAAEMAGAGDLTVQYVSTLLTGNTDSANLAVKGVGSSAASADFTTWNGASTGVAETLNIASTVTRNFLTINANNDHKTINVTGDSELRITNTLDTTVTKVDASGSTGGIQLTAGVSNIAITGSSGNDVISMAATLTTSDTIDGGAGTDTLSITDPTTLVASLNVSNIETIRLAAASATAYDLAYLAGYTTVDYRSDGNNALSASNVAEGTAAVISADNSNTTTHTVLNAINGGTVNAVTVTIDHGTDETDTDVGTLALPGIETVSLVSAGVTGTNTAADKLAGTDTTSTINSVATLTAASATTINVSGASDFQLAATGATLTALTTVNASALTGSLIYTNRAGATAATTITGGSAADAITGRSSTDSISGGAGNDSITGSGGNDTLAGGDGADTIVAGSGNDVITGGDGNDSITGSTGNDSISGGAGDDTFVIAGSDITAVLTNNDTVAGGDGTDSFKFQTDTTLDLTDAAATAALTNVTGIEKLVVDVANSTLTINDNIVGIANNSLAITNTTTAGVLAGTLAINAAGVLSSTAQVNTTLQAGTTGVVTYTLGNAKDNVNLSNSNAANVVDVSVLPYFGANDTLIGGSGSADELRFSHTTGQTVTAANLANVSGFEKVLVTGASGNFSFTLTDDVLARNYDTGNTKLTIGNSSNTSSARIVVDGSAVTSLYKLNITGGAGNDTLTGGANNDTFDAGSAGVDSVNGGAGTADSLTLAAVTYTNNDGVVVNVSGASISLITSVAAGGLGLANTSLTGEQTTSIADGKYGILETNGSVAVANVNLSSVTGIEVFTLGAGTDAFAGSASAETVNGAAGADTILGGGGADSINGGNDDDTIYGQDGSDTLNGDAGADVIQGGAGADTINGGASAVAADTLTGGSGNDVFVFSSTVEAVGALASTDTTASLMDKITDFVSGSDKIKFALTAAAFGTGITFTADTTVVIDGTFANGATDRATFGALVTAAAAGLTEVASTSAEAHVFLVTTGAITTATGFANKTFLVLNNGTTAIGTDDTWIDITGVSGTFATTDIIFG